MSLPFSTLFDSGIAELIFNHPPVNAFNSTGWLAIAAELNALGENPEVRAIIIAAEGRGFCAGVAIPELSSNSELLTSVNKDNYATS